MESQVVYMTVTGTKNGQAKSIPVYYFISDVAPGQRKGVPFLVVRQAAEPYTWWQVKEGVDSLDLEEVNPSAHAMQLVAGIEHLEGAHIVS